MNESDTKVSSKEAAALVSAFYESLARGRMVDALDLVATDAVLRDESGNESRGIGAIARSLLPYRGPLGLHGGRWRRVPSSRALDPPRSCALGDRGEPIDRPLRRGFQCRLPSGVDPQP